MASSNAYDLYGRPIHYSAPRVPHFSSVRDLTGSSGSSTTTRPVARYGGAGAGREIAAGPDYAQRMMQWKMGGYEEYRRRYDAIGKSEEQLMAEAEAARAARVARRGGGVVPVVEVAKVVHVVEDKGLKSVSTDRVSHVADAGTSIHGHSVKEGKIKAAGKAKEKGREKEKEKVKEKKEVLIQPAKVKVKEVKREKVVKDKGGAEIIEEKKVKIEKEKKVVSKVKEEKKTLEEANEERRRAKEEVKLAVEKLLRAEKRAKEEKLKDEKKERDKKAKEREDKVRKEEKKKEEKKKEEKKEEKRKEENSKEAKTHRDGEKKKKKDKVVDVGGVSIIDLGGHAAHGNSHVPPMPPPIPPKPVFAVESAHGVHVPAIVVSKELATHEPEVKPHVEMVEAAKPEPTPVIIIQEAKAKEAVIVQPLEAEAKVKKVSISEELFGSDSDDSSIVTDNGRAFIGGIPSPPGSSGGKSKKDKKKAK